MDIGKLLGLDKFDRVISKVEQRPLTLYAEQCLNKRDKKIQCDLCLTHCPTAVIDVKPGVQVDYDGCVNCGICVNICPTGVFEPRLNDDFYLARIQAAARGSEVIGFTCQKQKAAVEQGPVAEVEVACLGRVSEAMLVGAAVFGAKTVWLNVGLCSDCDCSAGLTLARQTVHGVDKLLEAWSRPIEFSLTAEPPGGRASDKTVSLTQGEYNRRELLIKFKREAMAAGLGLAQGRIDKLSGVFENPPPDHFTSRLPRKRELLLNLLKKLGQPPPALVKTDNLSFEGLKIEAARCNLCGNCAVFCPTEALEMEKDANEGQVLFNASRCLACGLCAQVCVLEAVTAQKEMDVIDLYEQDRRALVALNYYKCAKCRQPFAAAFQDELCDFCRLREGKLQDESWS